jgi:hypothetical protein
LNRREFLRSTTGLLLAPAISQGQKAAKPAVVNDTSIRTFPLAVLLVKFADSAPPSPASDYERIFGFEFPAFGHYLPYCTSGRLSIRGTRVIGWLDLTFSKEVYSRIGDPTERRLAVIRDAAAVALPQIDLHKFKHLVVFSSESIWQDRGGAGSVDINLGGKKRGFKWAFINDTSPEFRYRTTVREVGYALGLSGTWPVNRQEQSNWWSGMNGDSEYYQPGPKPHPVFGHLPLTYNAHDRQFLNGIHEEQVVYLGHTQDRTIELINLNNANLGGCVLIRIVSELYNSFVTLETRLYDEYYDRPGVLKSEGVVMHAVYPGRSRFKARPGHEADVEADAVVISPRKTPETIAWGPGQTFEDQVDRADIQIGARTEHGYTVHIYRA